VASSALRNRMLADCVTIMDGRNSVKLKTAARYMLAALQVGYPTTAAHRKGFPKPFSQRSGLYRYYMKNERN